MPDMTTDSDYSLSQIYGKPCDSVGLTDDRTNCENSSEEPRFQGPAVPCKIFPARTNNLAAKRHCPETSTSSENVSDENSIPASPIKVKLSKSLRYDTNEDYKMTARERGICLIINNVNFDTPSLCQRRGSTKDAYRFRDIFEQLFFKVELHRDQTAEAMRNLFRNTATNCRYRHNALVVIILSHGNETSINGVDGCEVEINEILSSFDNNNCRSMVKKPKIFITQACRGRKVDNGVRFTQQFLSQPESQSVSQPLSQLSEPDLGAPYIRWPEMDDKSMPTRTDMLLVFSCHGGYSSIRNQHDGSWLGTSLAEHLQKSAHEKHLIDILNMVSRDVRLRQSDMGHRQVIEVVTIAFDRNLFFNPGQYEA